jgi:hypothetical protein
MFRAVTPSTYVDPADIPNRSHGSFDPREKNAKLRGEIVREIPRLRVVMTGLEQNHDGKAIRLAGWAEPPSFTRPKEVLVGSGAWPALGPTFAFAGRVARLGRP